MIERFFPLERSIPPTLVLRVQGCRRSGRENRRQVPTLARRVQG